MIKEPWKRTYKYSLIKCQNHETDQNHNPITNVVYLSMFPKKGEDRRLSLTSFNHVQQTIFINRLGRVESKKTKFSNNYD